MNPCAGGCGRELPPTEEARYDVFDGGTGAGPFCATCFPDTVSGKIIASGEVPDTLDPEEG